MKLTDISASLVLLGAIAVTPAYGASVSFSPTGSQLDKDAINDLQVNVDDTIDFSFTLDTSGLTTNLQSLDLIFALDSTELLTLDVFRTDADIAAFSDFSGSPVENPPLGILKALFKRSDSIGVSPNSTLEIVRATYQVLPEFKNDGLPDLAVTVSSAIDANGIDVTSLFKPASQSLDVQPAPVPETTSLLGFLGLAALGTSSLLKNCSKRV
ncbi:MAG: hypothetical protein F6K10_29275 [Moorea sp. SIO2B7]|uniref:PEP-CTERM protein-sorting domain-containing protein n=1 Tax=Moorena producens (strain JHB) TaxID=1454205 RepID=A0A1D9G4M7_MOOP1|nr:hypothetical protein [Moorena producens]AOY82455.1 hypothetical protein BJP36_23645 [Moorena producens JHB]NES85175.1 hypothetical protein [Moorena sp. SIO2B7]